MEKVTHLVLSGGALKGIAFLGVLECFHRDLNLSFDNLTTLVGSSAGGFICALFAIGYTVAQLFKITLDLDLSDFVNPDIDNLLTGFGVDNGERIMEKIRALFKNKGFASDVTFAQLRQFTGKRLVIPVTCVGNGIQYFDAESVPNVPVLLAVRMTISIPGVFTAVQWHGNYYVDGGLLDNFPFSLDLFKNVRPEAIVAVRTKYAVIGMQDAEITRVEWSAEEFLIQLVKTLLDEISHLREQQQQTELRACIVNVPVEKLAVAAKINLCSEEKIALFREGYHSGQEYIASDAYELIQLGQLPYSQMRAVWQTKHHNKGFHAVLEKILSTT